MVEKSNKQKVHFLHIGKTGGSAIKSVLEHYLETPSFSIVLHPHETSLSDVPQGEKAVFFLRDPISRFVSGFYSRRRKGQPRYYSEWSDQERKVFEVFETPNQLACALADETSGLHLLAFEAMGSIEHLRTYQQWYKNFGYFRSRFNDIFFVGFQESLDDDFYLLKAILGIPEVAALPVDDVIAHRNPKNLDRSIEPHGIAKLREWYSEDHEFVSLCRDLMSCRVLHSG